MITERAMLAAVHISIWTAVKHDRKVSQVPLLARPLEVCHRSQAVRNPENAGRDHGAPNMNNVSLLGQNHA